MQEKHEGTGSHHEATGQQHEGLNRCPKCNQTFASAEELRRHDQQHHSREQEHAEGRSGQHEHSHGEPGRSQQQQGGPDKGQAAKRG
jgi:uncharacterized C2H2 Zn-finger protein